MNKTVLGVLFAVFGVGAIQAAEPDLSIGGVVGSLRFSKWQDNRGGWSVAEYVGRNKSFYIYPWYVGATSNDVGWTFYTIPERLSPGGRYIMLQRVDYSTVVNEEGKEEHTEQAFCEAVDLESGCVTYSGSVQACDGEWVGEKWSTSWENVNFSTWGTPPGVLADQVGGLKTPESRSMAVYDDLFMGGDSYMACYPLDDNNVADYNNLAFYLAGGGWHVTAVQLYMKLLAFAPERTPLKLNIADSLWVLGKKGEALGYYRDYRQAMVRKGKSARIPVRVNQRLH
ncbi:type IV pilus biogenesis/stability protein PilW [Pseudomonas sp. NPDC089406]|uniref:tetratricopeptide repeat protein n=1 Tax=Pseudomonas sp. NPDC089406 TaxID=3364463 RepID=UPI00384C4E51